MILNRTLLFFKISVMKLKERRFIEVKIECCPFWEMVGEFDNVERSHVRTEKNRIIL